MIRKDSHTYVDDLIEYQYVKSLFCLCESRYGVFCFVYYCGCRDPPNRNLSEQQSNIILLWRKVL